MKRIILVCVGILASTHTLALSRQQPRAAPETTAISLCHLTSHSDQYENKRVRVEASLQPVYLYSYVIGLILNDPDCESVAARFEKAEDEETVLNMMRDEETDQAQVTVIGKLRGPRRPDSEHSYGLMAVFKHELVIESVSIVKPLRKSE